MLKLLSIFGVLTIFLAEVSCQRFILPTFRPPPRRPVIIRTIRDVEREQPKWLYQDDIPRAPATGEHPVLPPYIDDIKIDPNRRVARSLDSPSAKRYGGRSSTSTRGMDTGATHPGYNRRNAREIRLRFDPKPKLPGPYDPYNPRPLPGHPRPHFPIYV